MPGSSNVLAQRRAQALVRGNRFHRFPPFGHRFEVSNLRPPQTIPKIPPGVLQAPIRCAILRACRTEELDSIMNIPEWTKPALVGAGAGAIALAIERDITSCDEHATLPGSTQSLSLVVIITTMTDERV